MSEKTETLLLVGAAIVVMLVAVYVMTKPEPAPSTDISWEQGMQLIATYAAYA